MARTKRAVFINESNAKQAFDFIKNSGSIDGFQNKFYTQPLDGQLAKNANLSNLAMLEYAKILSIIQKNGTFEDLIKGKAKTGRVGRQPKVKVTGKDGKFRITIPQAILSGGNDQAFIDAFPPDTEFSVEVDGGNGTILLTKIAI